MSPAAAPTSERYRYNILVDRIERLSQVQAGDYRMIVLDFRHTPFASSAVHTAMAIHMAREGIAERGGETHAVDEHHLFCLAEGKNQDTLKRALQEMFALTPGRNWEETGFVSSLHLRNDADRLKEIVKMVGGRISANETEAQKAKMREETAEIAVSLNGATRPAAANAFSTARFSPVVQLEFIEEQLPKMQFGDLLRSQPICRYAQGEIVEVVAQEFYPSIADLQKRFSTSIDMVAHYLLRHHLIHNLGQMLLHDLKCGTLLAAAEGAFVNLQIGTLGSQAFRSFDEAVGDDRRRITLELEVTDVLAHARECGVAAPGLRESGYGLALAGLTLPALEEIEIDRLPLSALKLSWQGDGVLGPKGRRRLDDFAAKGGLIILGRSNRKEAVAWGEQNGISHFQGVVVDAAAGELLHHTCGAADAHRCTPDRCRSLHWAPHRSGATTCPLPLWTSRPH